MRGNLLDLSVSLSGRQRVTIELDGDFRTEFDKLHEGPVEVSVKKFRAKRSLDANGYAWVLIDKIADMVGIPKAEVYRDHIRQIGGVSEVVCVRDKAVARLRDGWAKNGLGWQSETAPSKIQGCTNVILYYGSSTYDTRQMSALIDALVQTAKNLGIETLSPEKLNSLIGGPNDRQRQNQN